MTLLNAWISGSQRSQSSTLRELSFLMNSFPLFQARFVVLRRFCHRSLFTRQAQDPREGSRTPENFFGVVLSRDRQVCADITTPVGPRWDGERWTDERARSLGKFRRTLRWPRSTRKPYLTDAWTSPSLPAVPADRRDCLGQSCRSADDTRPSQRAS